MNNRPLCFGKWSMYYESVIKHFSIHTHIPNNEIVFLAFLGKAIVAFKEMKDWPWSFEFL